MKATFLLLIMAFVPMDNYAQYYNPYNPYQQQQAMMDAYRAGQQMAKQYMQQQEQMLRSNPLQMWGHIVEEIATGYYEKAYEHLEYLADECEDGKACLYAGYMNELGLGTTRSLSDAKYYYKAGQDNGNKECKSELKRIAGGGKLGKNFKSAFIGYFQNIYSVGVSSANSINFGSSSFSGGGTFNGNHSSSSNEYTCPTCHGTGRCTMCAGRGEYWYNGNHYDCSMCHGGGACYGCHGKRTIR